MADTAALYRQMLNLPPSDRSMLDPGVHANNKVELVTKFGSRNFKLWSDMAAVGWTVRGLDASMPEAPGLVMTRFSITDAGYAALPAFMAGWEQYHLEHAAKMTAIINGVCKDFAETFCKQLADSGAQKTDLEMMLQRLIYQILTKIVPPQDRKIMAGRIFEGLKAGLKDEKKTIGPG